MAMSDRAKKSNLCYLLIMGGTPVCKALFEKRVLDLKPKEENSKTWNVNKFLQLKRTHLESKLGYEKTLVLPRGQQIVNVDMWDVRLLCIVLKESCEPNPVQRVCFNILQEQRNKIAHLIDTDIDDSAYEDSFGILKWCIQTLLIETGDETLKHTVEDMIKQLETGNIPNEELILVQQTLLTRSKDITQQIRNQHEKTRTIVEKDVLQFVSTRETLSETSKPKQRYDNVEMQEDGEEANTFMTMEGVDNTAVNVKGLDEDMNKESDVEQRLDDDMNKGSDVEQRLDDDMNKGSDVEQRLDDDMNKGSDVEQRLDDDMNKGSKVKLIKEVSWLKQLFRRLSSTGSSDSVQRHNSKHQLKAVAEQPMYFWRVFEREGGWNEKYVDLLKNDIKGVKHRNVTRPRILLLGPMSSGKSSFINSVATIDNGYISAVVVAGFRTIMMTQYNPKHFATNFALIDTMGIAELNAEGIHVEDTKALMEGKFKVGCKFNPDNPMWSETKTEPTLEEVGHCIVIVVDARDVDAGSISANLAEKIKRIDEYSLMSDLPKVVVLSKIDLACGEIGENIENAYKSRKMSAIVQKAAEQFRVPDRRNRKKGGNHMNSVRAIETRLNL